MIQECFVHFLLLWPRLIGHVMILDAKCLLYYYTCIIDEEIEVHGTHLEHAEHTFEPRQSGG